MKKLPNLLIKKSSIEVFVIVVDLANMCQGNEDFPSLKEMKLERWWVITIDKSVAQKSIPNESLIIVPQRSLSQIKSTQKDSHPL